MRMQWAVDKKLDTSTGSKPVLLTHDLYMLGQIEVVCSLHITTHDPAVHSLRRLRCISAQCSTLRRLQTPLMSDLKPFLTSVGCKDTLVEIDVGTLGDARGSGVGPSPSPSTLVAFPKDVAMPRLRFVKASHASSLKNIDGIVQANMPLLDKLILAGTSVAAFPKGDGVAKLTTSIEDDTASRGTPSLLHSHLPLREFTLPHSLTFIDVSRCEKLKSLQPLTCLPRLAKLDISFTTHIDAVPTLEALDTLNAFSSNIKSIASCPLLSRLNITRCKRIKMLPRLTSITMLHASHASSLHDLRALRDSETLVDVNVSHNEELAVLPRLPKLKRLVLTHSVGVGEWEGLSACHNTIEELLLGGCDSLMKLPFPISSHPLQAIRILNLSGARFITDLAASLEGNATLEVLDVSRCESLKPKLPFLPALRILIAPSSGLKDISSLSKSPFLEELNIASTQRIVSLPRMPSLVMLNAIFSDLADVGSLQGSAVKEVQLPRKAGLFLSKLPRNKFPKLTLASYEDGSPIVFANK